MEALPKLKPAAGDRLLEHRDGVCVLEHFGGELRDGVYELARDKVGQLSAAACCCCGQEAVVDRENEGTVQAAYVVPASPTPCGGRTRRNRRSHR